MEPEKDCVLDGDERLGYKQCSFILITNDGETILKKNKLPPKSARRHL